jgi:isoleucyl-tRNA synthetase
MSLQEVSNTVRFADLELAVLARWERERTFQRSIERRAGAPRFVFYDGPPFATGLPHYGHILTSFIKDVVPRYQTMRGYCVPRRWGWDCHGLPVELEAERAGAGSRPHRRHGVARSTRVPRAGHPLPPKVAAVMARLELGRLSRARIDDGSRPRVGGVVLPALHARLMYEGGRSFRTARGAGRAVGFETRLDDAYRPRVDPGPRSPGSRWPGTVLA